MAVADSYSRHDGLYVCEVELFWKGEHLSSVMSNICYQSTVHNCDAEMKLQACGIS